LDNVRLGARLAGFSLRESYQFTYEAMDLVNITRLQDKDVEVISGGQQRRVQIARAIAQQADILLLDEPTIGLTMKHAHILWNTSERLLNRGKWLLYLHMI